MYKKLILLAILAILVSAFFVFGWHKYFTLESLQDNHAYLKKLYLENPIIVPASFFLIYVTFTALSLPAAAVLTLGSGVIFGFSTGLILVSFASSIGATIAFLIARYVFRDAMEKKFGSQLERINKGVAKDGWLYCFSARLIPAFPFFVVNVVMALTKLKTTTFYWSSQLGMLAGTAVFVNAGAQLGDRINEIEGFGEIFTIKIIGSFLLLAIFPFIVKFFMSKLKKTPIEV